FGDLFGVIIERVPEREDLTVRLGHLLENGSYLRERLLLFQSFQGRPALGLNAVHGLGRLRTVATKRALGIILGQVAGHAQQPSPRIENSGAVSPLLPKAEERFLHDVLRGFGVHPPRIGQRPDFAAMALVERFEVGESYSRL